jgi:hypothetical protein
VWILYSADIYDTGVTNARSAILDIREPFISTHPALTLSLAYRLDLIKTRDLAVSEMLGCRSDLVTDGIMILPKAAYLAITRHRNLRIQRYKKWIDRLTGARFVPSNPCGKCFSSRTKWILRMSRSVQSSHRGQVFTLHITAILSAVTCVIYSIALWLLGQRWHKRRKPCFPPTSSWLILILILILRLPLCLHS